MVIGITGGICCGKTTVLSVLKKLNFKVFNVDDISHDLLNEDEVKEEIKEKISKDVFCDNMIDRKKLASLIFSDEKKRKALNKIMHKRIIACMIDIISKQKEGLTFIEVPLLYELNLEKYFDKIILIYVSRKEQIKRIMKRDCTTEIKAKDMLLSQIDIEEKKKLSKYVIENTHSIERLEKDIKEMVERIKNECN
ncbi:dephospho-CoA kinase [Sneathia sp. DSM 16630]|uniref:dephospho-CoA kinase n=1 Tax=uncultured Sneathia sp. TaxID=278067 RepID=UPI0025964565|nr:dephospho-CoA kinase [uncultured Sneathia sp.]MBE2989190.1 dephospho-CoA kinase [Sneathia sp. DSM 16630]